MNPVVVARYRREWLACVRQEEAAATVELSWSLAVRSDAAKARLDAALRGEVVAVKPKHLNRRAAMRKAAREALGWLGHIGKVITRALSAAAGLAKARAARARRPGRFASLRRAVRAVVSFVVNATKENAMAQHNRAQQSSEFAVGEMVRATVTAQGMVKGEAYEVRSVSRRWLAVGGFTLYGLTGRSAAVFGVELSDVGNGHVLLVRA